ncbi:MULTISPECIES: DUF4190 domain-containing protein [Metallibacterium]|jgi:hypothetical protein|uniref:DUF4190 domain-containing protein n=1 Tax=Metallibacterium TaxID=1218803 RepID=UPI0026117934|nr:MULTISPECIES: DUF4190 domain-containing protein [Metallibacterium]MBW8074306.1 DUF4190 domain-containing protein [Metallibacterium scheffleri]
MNAVYVRTSGTAVASLVFGVLTWVMLPFIGAVLAVVLGHVARGEIRRAAPGSVQGDGMALAGLVLGYTHLALVLLFLAVVAMIGWAVVVAHLF